MLLRRPTQSDAVLRSFSDACTCCLSHQEMWSPSRPLCCRCPLQPQPIIPPHDRWSQNHLIKLLSLVFHGRSWESTGSIVLSRRLATLNYGSLANMQYPGDRYRPIGVAGRGIVIPDYCLSVNWNDVTSVSYSSRFTRRSFRPRLWEGSYN